jgi:hypothetical protein
MRGEPLGVIETRFTVTPYQGKVSFGDIARIADMTRYCLRSAYEIVSLIFPANTPKAEEMEAIYRSIEVGIPVDSIELLELPVTLSRGEYLELRGVGLTTVDGVLKADRKQLEQIIGRSKTEVLFQQ